MTRPLRLAGIGAGDAMPDGTAVEDVFSTYLYAGNASTQTIANGINLAGKGGLVWTKARTANAGHCLEDTIRGMTFASASELSSNSNAAAVTGIANYMNAAANGYELGTNTNYGTINSVGNTYVSWTFRKQPKFFDVVTYTGDDTSGRTIAHSLGVTPGFVIVKNVTSAGFNWMCWSTNTSLVLALNSIAAGVSGGSGIGLDGYPNVIAGNTSTFRVFSGGSSINAVNASGNTYVAYLFAHDPSSTGMIQCGSYTPADGSPVTVNLGWEPQWLLIKSAANSDNWFVFDNMRGIGATGAYANYLNPNLSAAESVNSFNTPTITATGFRLGNELNTGTAANGYVYIAIRRGPMRTPTDATKVFKPTTFTSTETATTVSGVGFAPDMVVGAMRSSTDSGRIVRKSFFDKLRFASLTSVSAEPEYANGGGGTTMVNSFNMDGLTYGADYYANMYNGYAGSNFFAHYYLRRAPGFFDVVCYTGTGVSRTVNHNLGVVPELMIIKNRNLSGYNWAVYSAAVGPSKFGYLSSSTAFSNDVFGDWWNNTSPTATGFTVNVANAVNYSAGTYVAYLFATCPGVSKVGSYTGNGSSQTINCGFAVGVRFVMIKRTDSTGDWYVWDSARGIVAGNDPHLSMNTSAAEVTTDDSVDADATGFIVNQLSATNVNVTGASYIFLAIA